MWLRYISAVAVGVGVSSALAANPSLTRDGWRAASRGANAVEFRSGDDSLDVVKRSEAGG